MLRDEKHRCFKWVARRDGRQGYLCLYFWAPMYSLYMSHAVTYIGPWFKMVKLKYEKWILKSWVHKVSLKAYRKERHTHTMPRICVFSSVYLSLSKWIADTSGWKKSNAINLLSSGHLISSKWCYLGMESWVLLLTVWALTMAVATTALANGCWCTCSVFSIKVKSN